MVYIVVNMDNSIHTIAEKPDDVLIDGQQRFELDMTLADLPNDFDNDFYTWNGTNISRKDESIINQIKETRINKIKRSKKINAQQKLSEIEKLEQTDPNEDYTEEKDAYQKIIDDNII